MIKDKFSPKKLFDFVDNREDLLYNWSIRRDFLFDNDYYIDLSKTNKTDHRPVKNLVSILPYELEWDGNYDKLADTLEKYSKDRFLAADKEYFRKTGNHIDINEGTTQEGNARRSCKRQAALWMSYNLFKTPGSAPANRPGCSDHNYGLAIDLKYYNDTLRSILVDNGWTDEFPGEKWHFTCSGSDIFSSVRSKIAELKTGEAEKWRLNATQGFGLIMEKNRIYHDLVDRHQRFEGDVANFNKHVLIFNDLKKKFHNETDHLDIRRNNLLNLMGKMDIATKEVEIASAEFREISDEIISVHYKNLEEIRILMSLPLDEIPNHFEKIEIPNYLQAKYQLSLRRFKSALAEANLKLQEFNNLLNQFNTSAKPFEVRAVELIKEYNHLISLRKQLEKEKNEIERGYIQVELLDHESLKLMNNANSLLVEIQKIVDETSPI